MRNNIAREIKDGSAVYDFTCEGCRAEGTLGVPLGVRGSFACPEKCGAVYVQWKNLEDKMQLACVVCPVFEDAPGSEAV